MESPNYPDKFFTIFIKNTKNIWKFQRKAVSLHRQNPPRFPLEQRTRAELFFMTTVKTTYNKEALDYEQIIALLKERGLTIEDESKAIQTLGFISYFRLAAYFRPMENNDTNSEGETLHHFKSNATFNKGIAMYEFDTKLRDLIFQAIQKIEIAIRTKMIHHISLKYGAFWFLDMNLCKSQKLYLKNMASIEREVERSKDDFIKEHYRKYNYPDFPPAWKTLELASFGTLSKLYYNLNDTKLKKKIAREFNLPQHEILESWMVSITALRNCCAHHSRLWNRIIPLMPQLNVSMRGKWISQIPQNSNRFYSHFCCVAYLLNVIDPKCSVKDDFKKLLKEYPSIDCEAMGFPINWEEEKLWE